MENTYKTIIDSNGYIIDRCIEFCNDSPQGGFVLEDGMKALDFYKENFVKPKWDGATWIEDATQEEINQYKENLIL